MNPCRVGKSAGYRAQAVVLKGVRFLHAFPRAGETVSGPSIRLAEMLAAVWGNIEYGIRELSRKEGASVLALGLVLWRRRSRR